MRPRADVGDAIMPTIGLTYFLTDNIAVEVIAGTTQHTVKAVGGTTNVEVHKTWVLPDGPPLERWDLAVNVSAFLRGARQGAAKDAATVASIHIAHLPELNSARFSLKPFELAPGGPAAFIRST